MNNIRKITGYVLIGLVIATTLIAVLGIWDLIEFEDAVRNLLLSLLVIFIASAVVLFITSVLIRDDKNS
jgi:hypothetical protein